MERREPEALYSLESEQALLGLLMTTSLLDGVGAARLLLEREQLSGGDFHLPSHGVVFGGAQALLAASTPVDPVSIFERVRANGAIEQAGGLPWLFRVHASADGMTVASFPNLARQVRELALRRRIMSEARIISGLAADHGVDVAQALAAANQRFASIVYRRDTFRSLTEVMNEIQTELVRANDSEGVRLLPTGIAKLDNLIGGLPPLLIVVGGRPGAGKSAIAATLTEACASRGNKLGVFSLEDRAPWLGYRLLSSNSGVPNQALRFQKLNGAQWERAGHGFAQVARYSDLVLIDDRRRMTATDIVQSARNMVVNHGVRCLLIDHLLEVKPREKLSRRDLEVADALGAFRDVANEYEIPVVVFTQLNRAAEGKKEPSMQDFKDAGAVEEMARVAIAIVRDGDTIGLCAIKNTNGVPGRVDVEFIGSAAMVSAVERQPELL